MRGFGKIRHWLYSLMKFSAFVISRVGVKQVLFTSGNWMLDDNNIGASVNLELKLYTINA